MTRKERKRKQLAKQMGFEPERGRVWTVRPTVFVERRCDKKRRRNESKKICPDCSARLKAAGSLFTTRQPLMQMKQPFFRGQTFWRVRDQTRVCMPCAVARSWTTVFLDAVPGGGF